MKRYRGLKNKKHVRMVFLDASKAFDKVWHDGLLYKLKQLGIMPIYCKLVSELFTYPVSAGGA